MLSEDEVLLITHGLDDHAPADVQLPVQREDLVGLRRVEGSGAGDGFEFNFWRSRTTVVRGDPGLRRLFCRLGPEAHLAVAEEEDGAAGQDLHLQPGHLGTLALGEVAGVGEGTKEVAGGGHGWIQGTLFLLGFDTKCH